VGEADAMSEAMIERLLAASAPPEKAAIVAERILGTLPARVDWVARHCAVSHWFDREIVAIVLRDAPAGREGADEIVATLATLPFVEPASHGLAFHQLTRTGLLNGYAASGSKVIVAGAIATVLARALARHRRPRRGGLLLLHRSRAA